MIRLILAFGLLAAPLATLAHDAGPMTWERSACYAWRDHLDELLAWSGRAGWGAQRDLVSIREAVAVLGPRCDTGDAQATTRLLVALVTLLAEDDDES